MARKKAAPRQDQNARMDLPPTSDPGPADPVPGESILAQPVEQTTSTPPSKKARTRSRSGSAGSSKARELVINEDGTVALSKDGKQKSIGWGGTRPPRRASSGSTPAVAKPTGKAKATGRGQGKNKAASESEFEPEDLAPKAPAPRTRSRVSNVSSLDDPSNSGSRGKGKKKATSGDEFMPGVAPKGFLPRTRSRLSIVSTPDSPPRSGRVTRSRNNHEDDLLKQALALSLQESSGPGVGSSSQAGESSASGALASAQEVALEDDRPVKKQPIRQARVIAESSGLAESSSTEHESALEQPAKRRKIATTTSTTRKTRATRKADEDKEEGSGNEESFHARPSVKIPIPDHLKALLVDDWENVTKNSLLVPIPCPKPVNVILDDYMAFERPKRMVPNGQGKNGNSAKLDVLEEVVAGLREYFDKCLGRILLYKYERAQYMTVYQSMNSGEGEFAGKEIGDIYGAEHFSRLLVSMPELIAQTNMDKQSVNQLRDELQKICNWLGRNVQAYFAPAYEHPGQEYLDNHRRS